jgi:hypothetical protein
LNCLMGGCLLRGGWIGGFVRWLGGGWGGRWLGMRRIGGG